MTSADPSQPLREAARVLFRQKRTAFACFLAVLAVTAVVTLVSPRVYRSQAKLFVRLGRENATLDPAATVGQSPVVAVPQSRENEINTYIEILKSRVLLEKVVDAVGPATVLGESPSADQARQRYRAGVSLAKLLTVEPVKKSNVIAVSYDGATPDLSRAVVSALLDFYLERHMQLSRTPGSQQFLAEQTDRQRAQLTKAEEELRDLKTGTGLVTPDVQRQLLTTRLGRLQDDLLQTTASLTAAEAEARLLREKLTGLAPTQVTARVKGVRNEAADNMRGQLYTLQLRELELRQKYPDGHPEIDKIRQQTAAAQEVLRKEAAEREQVTEGPNRLYEETQLALLRQEPAITALRAKADALRAQIDDQKGELRTLNDNDLRIRRQEREVSLQESHYRRYAENLEQAHIDRALAAERISNVSIIQPATLEVEPVRPRVLVNLIVGLLVALVAGVAGAFLAERLDRSVKSPADVEGRLHLPLLASVPLLRSMPARNGNEVLS